MFEVYFKENYAILSMKCGENRLNPKFLEDFHCALDKIERYLILFSWGCGVWSVKSWTYVGVWVLFLLYEGNVARLDSRILDHLFASRWEQKTCKHFFIFSYLVQSTAKYFRPVHPPCHTPNKIFYDNLLLPPPPPPFSFSYGKSPGNEVEPCFKVFWFYNLQSRQVKRTPQDSTTELIIWKMNLSVIPITTVKFKSAFQHAWWAVNILWELLCIWSDWKSLNG